MVAEGIEDVLNNEEENQNKKTVIHSTVDIGPNTISFEDAFRSPASRSLIFDSEEDSSVDDNDDNNKEEEVTVTEERALKRTEKRDQIEKEVSSMPATFDFRENPF